MQDRAYLYAIEIDDVKIGEFSEVFGLDMIEYWGNDTRAVPLIHPVSNITLKNGIMDLIILQNWADTETTGEIRRKTVLVVLADETGSPTASWQIANAWPARYKASFFDASSSKVNVESLEMVHKGICRVL